MSTGLEHKKSGRISFNPTVNVNTPKSLTTSERLNEEYTRNFEKAVKQRIACLTKQIVSIDIKRENKHLYDTRLSIEKDINDIEQIILM